MPHGDEKVMRALFFLVRRINALIELVPVASCGVGLTLTCPGELEMAETLTGELRIVTKTLTLPMLFLGTVTVAGALRQLVGVGVGTGVGRGVGAGVGEAVGAGVGVGQLGGMGVGMNGPSVISTMALHV